MKKILTTLAVATAFASTPALAGSIAFEGRVNGIGEDQSDTSQFKLGVKDSTFNDWINVGAEVRVKQSDNEGPVGAKTTFSVGPALPTILGIKPSVNGLIGRSFNENNNYNFWGFNAGLSRRVVGPVSVKVGYRHLEGFNNDYNSERVNGGLSYDLSEKNSVTVTYYKYFDGADIDSIGVGFTRKF